MRMALALNNLQKVDMPLNKETKPTNKNNKQQYQAVLFFEMFNTQENQNCDALNMHFNFLKIKHAVNITGL